MIIRHLCDLSKSSTKKTKVHSNILKVENVLSAFGNATTPFNQNATCFTKYFELQCSKGKMVGMKAIQYLLEKSRVSGSTDGAYTFHIFYYLLEGLTNEERDGLRLIDAAHFTYLSTNNKRSARYARSESFSQMNSLRENLKSLGISRMQQSQLWSVLAAILHIGNINFHDSDKIGEPCSIKNYTQLHFVAEILGVTPESLQTILTCRTRYVKNQAVSSYLDVEGAKNQRDSIARNLYAVVFSWIIEQINVKLCAPESEWENLISILEVPGLAGLGMQGNDFQRLLVNFANERLFSFSMKELHTTSKNRLNCDIFHFPVDKTFNEEVIQMLAGVKKGILLIVDSETTKSGKTDLMTAKIYEKHLQPGLAFVASSSKKMSYSFGVHHFGGIVEYDTRLFLEQNRDILQSSFVTLVRGNPEEPGTTNNFLRNLFSDKLIASQKSDIDGTTVLKAQTRNRNPSMRRNTTRSENAEDDTCLDTASTIGYSFRSDLTGILDTIAGQKSWFVFHLRTQQTGTARGQPDLKTIERQITGFELHTLVQNPGVHYVSQFTHEDFVARYSSIHSIGGQSPKTACDSILSENKWNALTALVGNTYIYLSETAWRFLEMKLKEKEDAQVGIADPSSWKPTKNSSQNYSKTSSQSGTMTEANSRALESSEKYDENFDCGSNDEDASNFDSEADFQSEYQPSKKLDVEAGNFKKELSNILPETKKEITQTRKNWLCFVWAVTCCCVPSFLNLCGKMTQKERQLAWREKAALCVIVLFMNCLILFFIVGIGYILCPLTNALSIADINLLNTDGPNAGKSIYFIFSGVYVWDRLLHA